MRVSRSAIGSVIITTPPYSGLPACLFNTRDQTVESQIPETDPADLELTIDRPRASAHHAAVLRPCAELWSSFRLLDL